MKEKELIKKAKKFQDNYVGYVRAWNLSRNGIAVAMAKFVLSLESELKEHSEITNEEITNYAFAKNPDQIKDGISATITDGCFISGAKAMRDGDIAKWMRDKK